MKKNTWRTVSFTGNLPLYNLFGMLTIVFHLLLHHLWDSSCPTVAMRQLVPPSSPYSSSSSLPLPSPHSSFPPISLLFLNQFLLPAAPCHWYDWQTERWYNESGERNNRGSPGLPKHLLLHHCHRDHHHHYLLLLLLLFREASWQRSSLKSSSKAAEIQLFSTNTLRRKLTKGGEIQQDEAHGQGGVKISTTSIPPSILHLTVYPSQAECLMSVCAAQQHGRVWRRPMSHSQEEEEKRRQEERSGCWAPQVQSSKRQINRDWYDGMSENHQAKEDTV